MEMERVTIELPIVKVEPNQPIWSNDFAKEHYEYGLMIVDDGVMRNFVFYDGACVFNTPCPHDVIDKYLVEMAVIDNDAIYHRDMEAIEERLTVIEKLCNDSNIELYRQKDARVKGLNALMDKSDAVINNFAEVRDDMLDIIEDKLGRIPKSGDGANVLDVAKAFAVISKPELIKELNK